jgi:hypothetical protein
MLSQGPVCIYIPARIGIWTEEDDDGEEGFIRIPYGEN